MTLSAIIERANSVRRLQKDYQNPRPTRPSIARINQHFGMELPEPLLEMVRCWRESATWFASLGPDYDSEHHIIRINSYWRHRRRTRRLPRNLVIINLCHDEDCDCLDLDTADATGGRYLVRYWSPEIESAGHCTLLEYFRRQFVP